MGNLAIFATSLGAPGTAALRVTPNVSVEINPNAELLGIVYYLAFGNDTFVINRESYLADVEEHFEKFRDSRAVLLLKIYMSQARNVPERDYCL
ncbi:hypothetical protein [Thermococcus sp.]|uniref:hypothetical protein n=1 Tax=Thermococcus sp. TaxID=35749 RepID=UPI0025F968F2|nr:hypothetical protein [Thermococcus sp.]